MPIVLFGVCVVWCVCVASELQRNRNRFATAFSRPRLTGEDHVERSLEPHDRVKKLRPPPPWQQPKLHLPVVHACRVTNCTEFSFNKKPGHSKRAARRPENV